MAISSSGPKITVRENVDGRYFKIKLDDKERYFKVAKSLAYDLRTYSGEVIILQNLCIAYGKRIPSYIDVGGTYYTYPLDDFDKNATEVSEEELNEVKAKYDAEGHYDEYVFI